MVIWDKVTLGVLRFLFTFPSIWFAVFTFTIYSNLLSSPLPAAIAHRPEIYRAQAVTAVVSVFVTPWFPASAYLNFVLNRTRHGYWFSLLSLVDIAVFASLAYASVLAAAYLPTTIAGCDAAPTWQVSGNASSLFQYVATSDYCDDSAGDCSAYGVCTDFMTSRLLGVFVMLVIGITLYCPLSRVRVPWPVIWLYGHLRLVTRLAVQEVKGLASSKRRSSPLPLQSEKWVPGRSKAGLLELLTHNDTDRTVGALAQTLDYVDLVALGLASNPLHHALFLPPSSPQRSARTELLYRSSCANGSKSACWSCSAQICKDCTTTKNLADTASETHLASCAPYCSRCYYSQFNTRFLLGSGPSDSSYGYRSTRSCPCKQPARSTAPTTGPPRPLCRLCARSTGSKDQGVVEGEAAVRGREERQRHEMAHLSRQLLRCGLCARGLERRGPRWWGCGRCHAECASGFHPSWEKGMGVGRRRRRGENEEKRE